MEVNLQVPALEKLLDYAASGIGSVAGPMLAPWRARWEATAKQIAAEGEVEVQRIRTEGQANTLQLIAEAQAKARESLVLPGSVIQGELDTAGVINQRIQFQEEKRLRNIGAVVEQAAQALGDDDVPDHEPNHDWMARFFNYVSRHIFGRDAIALGESARWRGQTTWECVRSDSKHSKES
ncbi:MAG: DUF2806 domain-containing protein [Truepera sp.]|nr:DUF2806 domain-containing protein [Truepera sp.]